MPVIWICIAYIGGILCSDLFQAGVWIWAVCLAASCLAACGGPLLCKRLGWGPVSGIGWLGAAAVIAFTLGGTRLQLTVPDFEDPRFITHFLGDSCSTRVQGVVVQFPDRRDQIQNLQVRVDGVDAQEGAGWEPASGLVLAQVPVELSVSYGDRVLLVGCLAQPPRGEGFDYQSYLARKGIYAFLSQGELEQQESGWGNPLLRLTYRLKANALERVYSLWPDPEASLLAGILLGVESGISDRVQQAFRDTGTTHIIAISGFNITIVAGLFTKIFTRLFNRRRAALAALLGIGFYTLLVGADPAVVRAAVMGGLSIFARQIGRRQDGLNAAALASLLMLLVNPNLIWDISFQLSLAAALGLILYADPLSNWFLAFSSRFLSLEAAQKITRPVSEYLLFTLAAQLTTLPVMLYHFQSFSLTALIANPAILPVQPPIMILGGLALILALLCFPVGQGAAVLVYPFVLYTIRVVEWFSRLPVRAARTGEISSIWIWSFYLLLALLTFGKTQLAAAASRLRPAGCCAAVGLAALLVWRGCFSAPDGKLHLSYLDVGNGSALYLESPSGQRVLINGGSSTRLLSDHLGRRLPPFQRDLDLVLVASPRESDIDALAGVLPRFRPDRAVWLGAPALDWEAENLRVVLEQEGIPLAFGEAGQTLVFSDGLEVKFLAVNQGGGTLLIEYGRFRGFFPFGLGEWDRQAWREGREIGPVSVYALADNGYRASNPPEWIQNLQPALLLVSVGVKDSQGLPDRGLLGSLAGYSLLRTDQHGTIELTTNGEKLWIRVDSPSGL